MGNRAKLLYEFRHLPEGRPFVLFIHGYNISQAEARQSYARFRGWLEEFQTASKIIEVHWPGNFEWGFASAILYPYRIRTARRCGALLARWIRQQRREARFIFVAHSLGCRVTLETVQELRRLGESYRIAAVCLMAAAVPVKHIVFRRLGPIVEEPARWRVLYSRGDKVLRAAFPSGQFFGFDGAFSYAVGLYGQPAERWKTSGETSELYQTATDDSAPEFYDHGYYWQGGPNRDEVRGRDAWLRESPPAAGNVGGSANEVAKLLGGKGVQTLPSRHLEPARSLPERIVGRL